MKLGIKKQDLGLLAVALALPQAAGLLGSVFTASAIPTWYTTLVRPEIAPPNWVFAPVWTTLFLLMGIALFLVWRSTSRKRVAMVLFFVQLALNVLWSVLFFGLHSVSLALVGVGVLWVAIAATAVAFYKISRTAAWLLLPYLLWVSFAAFLNYRFWVLNG